MKTITDIVSELQALDKTALDAVIAGLDAAIADLQAAIAPTPSTDPIVSVTVTTQSGVATEFVPKA